MNDPATHPTRLVETLEERFSTIERDFAIAWWESQIDATEENDAKRAELELELRRIKGDVEAFRAVRDALEHPIHDVVLRRQLQILRLSLTGNQMNEAQRKEIVELSTRVESRFSSHRADVDGEKLDDNEIEETLKTSNDVEERKKVWEASKQIGALVADDVRELARVRNAVARDLGYPDYYKMALDLQELDEDWLFSVMDEVENLTDEPFTRWKGTLDDQLKARFGASTLYPWHYADPFFQNLPPDGRPSLDAALGESSAVELARNTFRAWSMDIDQVLEVSDVFPRENKCQHAFCMDTDRSGRDVRILANVVPGERWVEVMLHESGHAAYDVGIDRTLPWLLRRPSHTFTTEGMALLSGRLVRERSWLSDIAQLDEAAYAGIVHDLKKANAAQSLVLARWILVMVHFERDLYADPESDLNSRWWEIVERMQKVTPPPDRDAPDWAAKIHIAAAPVYYQNYLLGEILASQLASVCEEEAGQLLSPAAGRLLNERFFAPGASMRWDALIRHATGRDLSAADHAGYVSDAA